MTIASTNMKRPREDLQGPTGEENGWERAKTYVVNGGNVQFGDQYYCNESSEKQRILNQFVESLRFPEMRLRFNQVSDSYPGTFKWLLETESLPDDYPSNNERASYELVSWLRGSDPIFWIHGKPGSGKSTLVKMVSTHERTQELLQSVRPSKKTIILRHFFWLLGEEVQRSLKGCLAALLWQFCDASPEAAWQLLQHDTDSRVHDLLNKRVFHDWSVTELEFAILKMHLYAPLCCLFIDGVDEFDRGSPIDDFTRLIKAFTTQGIKVCLSSRPEPHIERLYGKYPKLHLQDVTKADMRTMVEGKLTKAVSDVGIVNLGENSVHTLANDIVDKAEGVFLWACLAIKRLSSDIHNGDGILILKERLKCLPRGMKELYQQMWARLTDEDLKVYGSEPLDYLSMAEYLPMSLLRFTLAVHPKLHDYVTQQQQPLGEESESIILQACLETERKLSTRTGGLFESIRVPHSIPNKCCHKYVANISMHDTGVILIHRSTVEFLLSADGGSARIGVQSRIESRRKACSSLASLRRLGCFCSSINNTIRKFLDHDVGSDEITRIFEPLVTLEVRTRSSHRRLRCLQGAYSHCWVDSSSPDQYILDFAGLAATLGAAEVVRDLLIGQKCTSRYYRGYLVLCAARSIKDHPHYRLSQRIELMCWLISNGADMTEKHVTAPYPRSLAKALLFRSPLEECWVSLFTLIQFITTDRGAHTQVLKLAHLLLNLSLEQDNTRKLMTMACGDGLGFYSDLSIASMDDDWVIIEAELGRLSIYCCQRLCEILCAVGSGHLIPSDMMGTLAKEQSSSLSQFAAIAWVTSWFIVSRSAKSLKPDRSTELLELVEKALLGGSDEIRTLQGKIQTLREKISTEEILGLFQPGMMVDSYSLELFDTFLLDRTTVCLVPPKVFQEPEASKWYEQGELREWLMIRDRMHPKSLPHIEDFEFDHGLRPSRIQEPKPDKWSEGPSADPLVPLSTRNSCRHSAGHTHPHRTQATYTFQYKKLGESEYEVWAIWSYKRPEGR